MNSTVRPPFYPDRIKRNIRKVIDGQGYSFTRGLQSITKRQLYRIEKGESDVTVGKLQAIADEIGVDLLIFFER